MPTHADDILAMFRELDRMQLKLDQLVKEKDARWLVWESASKSAAAMVNDMQIIRRKIIEGEKAQ